MNELAVFLFWLLFTLAVIQLPATIQFIQALRKATRQLAETSQVPSGRTATLNQSSLLQSSQHQPSLYQPQVTVILCLRGADPSLVYCLKGLLSQDYPHYNVRIVVDSEADPAWMALKPVLEHHLSIDVQVSLLKSKYLTCGLKCSALLQAISELDPNCEVVALLDADTIPHASWLRELVEPLGDPRIGLTTGNRWYFPTSAQWGGLARSVNNVSAVVGMHFYGVAWAGTMALRKAELQHPEFLRCLEQALVEDAPLCDFMRSQNLQVHFVPSLLMTNREECTMPQFIRWLTRQLINARLYHPKRQLIMGVGFLTAITPVIAALLLPLTLWLDNDFATQWLAAGFLLFVLCGVIIPMVIVEQQVERLLALRGEMSPPFSLVRVLKKYLLVLPLVYVLDAFVVIFAVTRRSIEWRGITYQIDGPWQIRLTQYTPYQRQSPLQHSNVSL